MTVVFVSSHGRDQGKIISSDCREINIEVDILR